MSGQTVRWSLITVAYNSAATLRQHWTQPIPDWAEWIVVDNASADESAAVAVELGATLIQQGRNSGFSAANNAGLAIAAGQYVAFVNPDVVVDWSGFDRLAATIDAHDALVAPQLTYPDGRLQPNGRHAPTYPRKVVNRLGFPEWSAEHYYVLCPPGRRRYATWAIGAAIAGRTRTVRAIGGWDERYFVYEEDKEICFDAWEAGHPVIVDGDVRWVHSWARATKRFRLRPWLLTWEGERKFYRQRPGLFFTERWTPQRDEPVFAWSGRPVEDAPIG